MLMQALLSVGGIALIVTLAWLLFGRAPGESLAEREMMEAARAALPLYRPVRAVCGRDGRGGLAVDAQGRVAIMKPHGSHFSARLLAPGTPVRMEDGRLIVETKERMFGAVRLDLGEAAPEWLAMIEDMH